MRTIQDLKNRGINCENIVQVSHCAVVMNLFTRKQVVEGLSCECCGQRLSGEWFIPIVVPSFKITDEIIEKINNAKWVAWRSLDSDEEIAFRILDEELIGYEL